MTGPAITPKGFDVLIGFSIVEADGDHAVGRLQITPELLQPYGIVHGGVYAAMVESAASIGGALWFHERGHVVGVSNTTNFLKATGAGTLTATARPLQRGRTQQLWDVAVTNENDRLVATGQVRLANITDAAQLGSPGRLT